MVPLCVSISDTSQDKEKDKHEAEYMLQENGKAMYEHELVTNYDVHIFRRKIKKKIYIERGRKKGTEMKPEKK